MIYFLYLHVNIMAKYTWNSLPCTQCIYLLYCYVSTMFVLYLY